MTTTQIMQPIVDIGQIAGLRAGELLNELEFEVGLSISVGGDIGFPSAVTIAVEHTAVARTVTSY